MTDSNFAPIPAPDPPGTGDSNPPGLDTSKMRIGNLLAQGKSARVYDVTIPDTNTKGKDTENGDTYKPYILKMIHGEEDFIREKAAYERMEEIPTLKGFVPRYYGTPQIPYPYSTILQSIILSNHDGMKLEDVISKLALQELLSSKQLLRNTIQILHGAGIYHGRLTPKNILVSDKHGHQMIFINFCHSALKKDVEDSEVEEMEDIDLCCVGEIFDELIWAKAHEAATNLLRGLRNGHQVEKPQYRLAELLDINAQPHEELVRSIMDVYTVPDPVLALPLAKCLAHSYKYSQAIEILKKSADTFTQLTPPSEQQLIEVVTVLQMKMAVARYTARLRAGSKEESLAFTKSHYEEAIRFYLCSMPDASLADKTAMTLRHELAKYYSHFDFYRDAMDLCIQALIDAIDAEGEIAPDVWRDYGELIQKTKKTLSHLINDINEDKLKGKERSWRPWADLPMYEEAYHRAAATKGIWDEQWTMHRMKKLSVEPHHGMKLDG